MDGPSLSCDLDCSAHTHTHIHTHIFTNTYVVFRAEECLGQKVFDLFLCLMRKMCESINYRQSNTKSNHKHTHIHSYRHPFRHISFLCSILFGAWHIQLPVTSYPSGEWRVASVSCAAQKATNTIWPYGPIYIAHYSLLYSPYI